jgi:cytochrome c oxidase cbb3-type subunit 3
VGWRVPRLAARAAVAAATGGAPDVARGEQFYRQACSLCHGGDGKGGHGVGAPLVGLKDLAAVTQTVTAGRNGMPPFRSSFTPEQIRDVSAYVVERLSAN